MENKDTIFEQFKNAAQKAETKDFSEMEKVWSRIDAKLDTVVYKKQNQHWKNLTIAASVVIVGFIAYLLINNNSIQTPENNVVISKTKKEKIENTKIEENKIEIALENINNTKKDTNRIIKSKNESPIQIIISKQDVALIVPVRKEERLKPLANIKKDSTNNTKNYRLAKEHFDPIIVKNAPQTAAVEAIAQEIKQPPLLVIDGKKVSNSKKTSEEIVSDLNTNEFETVYLDDPLYIINGYYYSEQDLFGKTPTSPYAPLDKQEIKTIKILQTETETAPYGKKGKKGVVIITTKTGKPAVLK